MLITIKKITKTTIPSPIEGGKDIIKNEVLDESIDVWSIRSIRDFPRQLNDKYPDIKGDISVIYLHGGESKGRRTPEIHVNSEHLNLKERVNDLRGRAQKNS